MFFMYNSQKNSSSFVWLFFIALQIPYYYFRKSRIIISYTDDSKYRNLMELFMQEESEFTEKRLFRSSIQNSTKHSS